MKNICVIGIGYVGLPTAAMFALKGHKVIGYDLNEKAVNALNEGKIIIEEPGLSEFVKKAVESGNLTAQTTCPKESDVYIIAVPTPINIDKTADMRYVESSVRSIVDCLEKGNIVILESTSPPRTVEDLMIPILKESKLVIGEDILVAHSPERILPGNVIEELRTNSRIVGGINEKSSKAVKEIYESIVDGEIYITTSTTAEMCKLMENTFRDVNIALANELAKMSEELGVNAWEVIYLANKHPRVNILSPGPGVGGHCIALDPWFLVEKSQNAQLIKQSRNINDSMPSFVMNKIKNILGKLKGKTVTVLGVTYKPNIDDVRESPLIHLVEMLHNEGVSVKIHDPHAGLKVKNNYENINEAAENSDIIVLGVNHDQFNNINFDQLANIMKSKIVLDTRNFFNKENLINAGFKYYILGEKQ